LLEHGVGGKEDHNESWFEKTPSVQDTETSTRKATGMPMDMTTMPAMPERIMLRLPKRVASTPVKKAGQMLMKSMMSVPMHESSMPASRRCRPSGRRRR